MLKRGAQQRAFAVEKWALVRLAFGPLVWAWHLILCYGATAIWCAKLAGGADSFLGLRLALGVLTLLALVATAVLAWKAWQQWDFLDDWDHEHPLGADEDRHEFLGHAAFLLAVLSFIGVIYTGLPLLIMETCR